MRFTLATLDHHGVAIPAIGLEGGFWPLALARRAGIPGLDGDVKALLRDWSLAFGQLQAMAAACAEGRLGDPIPGADAAPGLPIRHPDKLLGIGANYADHLAEMNADIPKGDEPVLFLVPPSALTGPGAVAIPLGCTQFDWEVELAVVIGRKMRRIAPHEAMAGIAGYTVAVDFTAREAFMPPGYFFKADFLRGKGQDRMKPIGPVILPAAFVPDPHALRLSLSVNGVTKQDASTGGMIWRIDEQIAAISRVLTLEPGDVVMTGSPAGVGLPRGEFLRPGDRVTATVEGIGTLALEMVDGA